MDKWFPVGLFRCVQYCCYLLFYIIRQVCDTPWIHCKAVLLVNLSMLCRLDDLSDWKDKCKFLCSYSLAMAGWRRGPTKEKERITSPLLHQPKSMLWFWHIKGIALPFLYINLISMHRSIWSFNILLLDNPRAFKLSKIGLFKFPHPSTRENCVQSSTEVPHLTVKLFFVKGTISNSDFLVNLPFKAICLPSTSILKDQIPPPPPFHLHCRHGQQSNASGLQVGGERGDVDKLYTNWLVHNTLTICHTIPMIPMMQVLRI